MQNKYTGEFEIILSGKTYRGVFDWTALAAIESSLGLDKLTAVLKARKPADIAQLVQFALSRHHPEVTTDMVMWASPPVVPTVRDIERALVYAYQGPGDDAAPEIKVQGAGSDLPGKKTTSRKR